MPAKRYRVRLTAEERRGLETQVNTGTGSGRLLRRARILLMADEAQVGVGFRGACAHSLASARAVCHSRNRSCAQPHDRNGSNRAYWMERAKPAWCS